MENYSWQKLKIIEGIGQLVRAIDAEVDWFIAYTKENRKWIKAFYFSVFLTKREERIETARRLSHE